MADGHTRCQQDEAQNVREISPSGHNRGDEDNPNSCDTGPTGTSSSCDDTGGDTGRYLLTNMQPAVET